jgi:hypothetical protein
MIVSYEALIAVIGASFTIEEDPIDKLMRKEVTKPIRKAEKVLKKAEMNNQGLAKYDEKVRDPIINKAKRQGVKIRKPPKGRK